MNNAILVELKEQEIPDVMSALGNVASSPACPLQMQYNLHKVLLNLDFILHKNNMCDAKEHNEKCLLQRNIENFVRLHTGTIAFDPDFKEGGRFHYIKQIYFP